MSGDTLEKEQVVEGIVRLRKIGSDLDDAGRAELYPVISMLEDAVGPTLSQSEVGRLLGVSHTTIGRWVEKGDIPTVPTPRVARRISAWTAVRLLHPWRKFQTRRATWRSRESFTISASARPTSISRCCYRRELAKHVKGHRKAELRSLAYHRAVARRLNKRILGDAQHRLVRWEREGRIHPTWAAEWHRVLAKSEPQIARVLSSDSVHSRALRQSSPFAGVLTEHERRRVIDGVEKLVK